MWGGSPPPCVRVAGCGCVPASPYAFTRAVPSSWNPPPVAAACKSGPNPVGKRCVVQAGIGRVRGPQGGISSEVSSDAGTWTPRMWTPIGTPGHPWTNPGGGHHDIVSASASAGCHAPCSPVTRVRLPFPGSDHMALNLEIAASVESIGLSTNLESSTLQSWGSTSDCRSLAESETQADTPVQGVRSRVVVSAPFHAAVSPILNFQSAVERHWDSGQPRSPAGGPPSRSPPCGGSPSCGGTPSSLQVLAMAGALAGSNEVDPAESCDWSLPIDDVASSPPLRDSTTCHPPGPFPLNIGPPICPDGMAPSKSPRLGAARLKEKSARAIGVVSPLPPGRPRFRPVREPRSLEQPPTTMAFSVSRSPSCDREVEIKVSTGRAVRGGPPLKALMVQTGRAKYRVPRADSDDDPPRVHRHSTGALPAAGEKQEPHRLSVNRHSTGALPAAGEQQEPHRSLAKVQRGDSLHEAADAASRFFSQRRVAPQPADDVADSLAASRERYVRDVCAGLAACTVQRRSAPSPRRSPQCSPPRACVATCPDPTIVCRPPPQVVIHGPQVGSGGYHGGAPCSSVVRARSA